MGKLSRPFMTTPMKILALYQQLQLMPNEDNILHHKGIDLFSP